MTETVERHSVWSFIEAHFEEIISCAALALIACCVMAQVISRFVFNLGLTWTEELAGFAMPWAIYTGAALGVRERYHIRIFVGVQQLPRKMQFGIIYLGDLLWFGFNVFMIRYGVEYLQLLWERPTISPTLYISRFWPETIVVLAYALMLLRLLQIYWKWMLTDRQELPGC
jgi:TRAP-type C4-dicarboxylate transport system permease small subunit